MRRAFPLLLAAAVLAAVTACSPRPTLHVGRLADQPHSALMAELVVETLRIAGARATSVACPDLMSCGRRLQAGDIDLLPEYSGSARVFFNSATVQDGSLDTVRRVLASVGMTATPGFGVDAPYVLLMDSRKASAGSLSSIEHLSRLEDPGFAVPPGYTRQPGDGLLALARRYGLDVRTESVEEIPSPVDRITALLEDHVDVVVMRAPYLRTEMELVKLDDTLGFYPRYQATTILGRRAEADREFILSALEPLYGTLKSEEVATAFREIAIQGRDPTNVARRLLVSKGIMDADSPTVRRPEIIVAYAGPETLSGLDDQATLVLRRAFPERPVTMLATADPLATMEQGRADLALLHTSDFFELTPDGLFLGRDRRAEAITVVGQRQFILLVSSESAADSSPLNGRVGVPPGWTAAGKVAARMLLLAGRAPGMRTSGPGLIRAVRDGELDAAIVSLDTDTRAVLRNLRDEDSQLRIEGLTNRDVTAPFFMNVVRLPASDVPGRGEPLDTVSMQVLLAGPAPRGRTGPIHGGPASAVATRNLPLPLREAQAIAAAATSPDVPDPVLPSFQVRQAVSPGGIAESAWLETLLIVAGILFMAWAGWLLTQPPARRGQ
ncbi:MAG TPA: glycine betaine ABC transporter substrate-binding protein [Arenicellales bacterium]|nr:glycine betaine ABC transporter substrate-binding protein [Arenicellales bacterium]